MIKYKKGGQFLKKNLTKVGLAMVNEWKTALNTALPRFAKPNFPVNDQKKKNQLELNLIRKNPTTRKTMSNSIPAASRVYQSKLL